MISMGFYRGVVPENNGLTWIIYFLATFIRKMMIHR